MLQPRQYCIFVFPPSLLQKLLYFLDQNSDTALGMSQLIATIVYKSNCRALNEALKKSSVVSSVAGGCEYYQLLNLNPFIHFFSSSSPSACKEWPEQLTHTSAFSNRS